MATRTYETTCEGREVRASEYGRCPECNKQTRRTHVFYDSVVGVAQTKAEEWVPEFIHDRCWAINQVMVGFIREDIAAQLAGRPSPFASMFA